MLCFIYTSLVLGVQWNVTNEFARTATKLCPTKPSEHIGACIITMMLNGGIEMVSRVKIWIDQWLAPAVMELKALMNPLLKIKKIMLQIFPISLALERRALL